MPEEVLYCEPGDHTWLAEVTPGQPKPTVCPYHAAQQGPLRPSKGKRIKAVPAPQPAEEKVQRLYCEEGKHEWTRPPQRGKRPKNCPEHSPQPKAPGEKRERQSVSQADRSKILTLAAIRERFPFVDDESARVFAYIEQQMYRPEREESVTPLLQAYKARLRYTARRHGTTTPDDIAVAVAE